MKRTLGRSGLEVSAMGLGCWAIGGPWWYVGEDGSEGPTPSGWGALDDKESVRGIHAALELGIDFFDTADAYGCGHSEWVLGKALEGRQEQVIVATKFGKQFDEEKKHYFGHKTSPELIRRACEASLRRLDREVIDLYQFHWGDYEGEAAMVRDCLEELAGEGKIRYYGWSTDLPENAAVFAEGEHCIAIQHFLSVLYDAPEMLAACETFGLASINRGPLAMGLLAGKYDIDTQFPKDDIRIQWDMKGERTSKWLTQIEALKDVLTSGGRSLVQGALAWIWARAEHTIPIPGFKTVAQVEENAGAMQFGPLIPSQMAEIETILAQ